MKQRYHNVAVAVAIVVSGSPFASRLCEASAVSERSYIQVDRQKSRTKNRPAAVVMGSGPSTADRGSLRETQAILHDAELMDNIRLGAEQAKRGQTRSLHAVRARLGL